MSLKSVETTVATSAAQWWAFFHRFTWPALVGGIVIGQILFAATGF